MGFDYLTKEAYEMVRHYPLVLARYVAYVAAKTLGTLLGHIAERLPSSMVRRISMHPDHWSQKRR